MRERLGECPPQLPLAGILRLDNRRTWIMTLFSHAGRLPPFGRALGSRRACGLAAGLVLALVMPACAQDKDPVVAKVNGAEIRASDVAAAEEELGSSLQQF